MDLGYIVEHRHYRFTLSVAGSSLRSIAGTSELLQGCYDAFVGEYVRACHCSSAN